MKKYLISVVFVLGILGCNMNFGKSKGKSSSSTKNIAPTVSSDVSINNNTSSNCVEVYTLGNVVNAVVTDINQTAEYNDSLSKYCFKETIHYPIKVKVLTSSYIDVDYDNKKTANDIKPKFTTLESYYPYIDLITDMHARAVESNLSFYKNLETNESNITVNVPSVEEVSKFYEKNIYDKYNVNLASPGLNEKILNFVAYDYHLKNTLDINSDLFDAYNNLAIFFNDKLNKPSIDNKVKYYSFFHSLELLDKKLIQRVDTIHRPNITYLHPLNLPVIKANSFIFHNSLIAKDIKVDANINNPPYADIRIFIASGTDGIIELNKNLDFIPGHNKKVSQTFSNSYNLDILNSNDKHYLLVADGGQGIDVFDTFGGKFDYLNKIFWKYYNVNTNQNVYITIDNSEGIKQIDDAISLKSYVSPLGQTIWVSFGTKNKGLYLVDFKKIIPKLDTNLSYPMIILDSDYDTNNTLWIPGDKDTVYSEAFSSDGENLYATKKNIIERYDLSSLITGGAQKPTDTYNIKAANAYNLKMITNNGADELFVSTNKGVEVYDVLNNYDLAFKSEYNTSGASVGYLPKMSFISEKNILLFTDGYQGLKAIKYDESYNPKLCGIGYFYPYSDPTKLAKVTSVASYKDNTDGNYYVLVGIDGFGVAKFKLDDLLFKHCQ